MMGVLVIYGSGTMGSSGGDSAREGSSAPGIGLPTINIPVGNDGDERLEPEFHDVNYSIDREGNDEGGYDSIRAAVYAFYILNDQLYKETTDEEEVFGRVYGINGRYYFTNAVVLPLTIASNGLGGTAGLNVSFTGPINASFAASIHTHPNRLLSDNFSDQDILTANTITLRPVYLRTVRGALREYIPGTFTTPRVSHPGVNACPEGTGSFCLDQHPDYARIADLLEPFEYPGD